MLPFVLKCQKWLSQSPDAMAYLKDHRLITDTTIASSSIGYFPKGASFNPEDGYPRELDKLRGRIIIPIFSEFGGVVGIAGRIPDPNAKGWWNTSFTKASHLYGLMQARKAMYNNNKVYVFEGYFDKIVLAQYGLINTVAAMGTDIGVRRIGLIARYCDRICVCFDTDANDAGLLGMFRTLADMYAIGIGRQPSSWQLTMIQLPVKVDPDEFVSKYGLKAFLALEKPLGEDLLKMALQAYTQLKWRMKDRKNKENKGRI